MIEYAIWTSGISKAPGIVNTSLISLRCMKDLERKDCGSQDPQVAKRAGNRNAQKWCMAHSACCMLL